MAFENISGDGMVSGASGSGASGEAKISISGGSIKYDNPFLDMTSTFLPRSIKSMLSFIAVYVLGDGFVSQCIAKLSEYPITDLLYNEEEASSIKQNKSIEKWKNVLEKQLKLTRTLKQSGMDYYAYGNSVISIHYPFKRQLQCPKCKEFHSIEALKNVKFKGYKFYADCQTKKCFFKGKMSAHDLNTKEINKLGLVHWDLINLIIKYNSITGDHFYYYVVPKDLTIAIRSGDMDIVNTTRLEVVEAVKKGKKLKLMSDNVFHLKRAAPQYILPSERGWGIPAVLSVIKDIFHVKILKKGNEMIAFDHIVPLRILFPQGTGDVSPHATINLSSWKTKIEEEIKAWRQDPNRIAIVPLPVGMTNFSGDARMLMTTPEIKATEDTIITGIGIIPEIIRGGASWSGSNVSLRVVENSFLNHRNDMQELIDFVVERVSKFLDYPKIEIKMSDFKMADDMQRKELMLRAATTSAANAIISKSTVTKELGFDPVTEMKNVSDDLKMRLENIVKEAEIHAEAQGAAALLGATYDADAQIAQKDRMDMRDRENQAKRDKVMQEESTGGSQFVQDEVGEAASYKGIDPANVPLPNLILNLTQRFARLATGDREEFRIRMLAIKNAMPNLYHEIYTNLKEMNLIEADTCPDLEMVQKYTPGQIPVASQGDSFAEDAPSPAEGGASVNAVNSALLGPAEGPPGQGGNNNRYSGPLPESRPPVSPKAPI